MRINICPGCNKRKLPNCCVCLLPVSIWNPYPGIEDKRKPGNAKLGEMYAGSINFDDALVWC